MTIKKLQQMMVERLTSVRLEYNGSHFVARADRMRMAGADLESALWALLDRKPATAATAATAVKP